MTKPRHQQGPILRITMTPAEYTAALAELGLSHSRAAALWGKDVTTSRRYSKGQIPIPEATAKLLRLYVSYPDLMKEKE